MGLELSRSKTFFFCCLIFILGIALVSFAPVKYIQNGLVWFIGLVSSGVILILFWKNKKIRLTALLGLFLFFGLWRYSISIPKNYPDKIWHYNGQVVNLTGYVSNEPDTRERSQKLEIKINSAGTQNFAPPQNVTGKILATTNIYPEYNYGDELEINCQLQSPEEFSGFAYDRYLARYNIYSVCYYPKIKKIDEKGSRFYKKIFAVKNKLKNTVNFGLPEPEAGLANAIILGYKQGIGDELRTEFSRAGLSHIVAISGLHISIISVLVMGFFLAVGLSRLRSFWLASLFLAVYIILIGLPASAMRAGLMGFLVLWAMNLGRLNKLTNSLILAAVVLLMINPRLLRDDIGFQLSFLAVLGIGYFYPIFDSWLAGFKKLPKAIKAAGSLINVTISAQVFTLPIIAYSFSQVSIIAPASNLLVLWILPVLMVAILVALFLSLIFPGLAALWFFPAQLALKYVIIITDWLVKIPYAFLEIDYLWIGWAVLYYIIIAVVILYKKRATSNK
ncbi:hypothetical protein COV49_03575 [Candidatus Falkowbacteria bacterium CG11_big_fil_rev_8_21_14_0_20_39_10]|uniref:ComEC/Rec2-related protein domain-containing protein n=1 Tax=Candidatus Falkowbacteria bacterium CG11_big_fil_rev_8_21_14_0_20_39_10 TaxID=1974570 RepID=A0A2M6K8E9_9BACT|nr:MAG: hypothetical protein COV49_03575 [Candidatus Falkowbacteria bacterium CG11_big_fil_rev_8_21_14_0_20_39_10]